MTAQDVIKQFMAALTKQNYSTGTMALDDAVKASSRFNGIQDALDNFYAAQNEAQRDAIKTILGDNYKEEYDGLQLEDLIEMAETDTELSAVLNETARYSDTPRYYGINNYFTAIERIRMLTAETFMKDYCGVELERYFFPYNGYSTYYNNYTTGNIDTGAITGSDAGGDTAKDSDTVVPEIGNKYTAKDNAPQIINTGSNDWIVAGTSYGDTITSGGTDSIDAAGGADIIYVEGENSTVRTGADDNAADSVTVRENVKKFNVESFDEFDILNIEGDFVLGSASLSSDDIVTVTDSTGKRIFTVSDWTNAQNASVTANGETFKFGNWLADFIYYEEVESTNTAVTSTSTATPLVVNLENVTGLGGSFSISSAANETVYNPDTKKGEAGTISSEFPNITTFSTRGLTVELWGESTSSTPSRTGITTLTLDTMSDAQKNVFAALYKWWMKEGLKLNEESFGLSFSDEQIAGSNIKVFFYTAASDGTLAFVRNHGSGKDLELGINMAHFANISSEDENGTVTRTSGSSSVTYNLDRTIAHELTHAIMAAYISNFNKLPQFISEGLAELVHGIDDERGSRIWDLAGGSTDTSRITSALDLNDTGTGDGDAYAGGYLFLRYFAKQAAAQTEENIVLGDAAAVRVNLSGENEIYYANLNDNSTMETATTVATEENYSVGAADSYIYTSDEEDTEQEIHTYTLSAGIVQQIYSTNDDWEFGEFGDSNTLVAGAGSDSVSVSGSGNVLSLGGGNNFASLSGSSNNSITATNGNDSIYIYNGSDNSLRLGEGDNFISINGGFNSSITATNGNDTVSLSYSGQDLIELGDGDNVITIYDSALNTINTGNGADSILANGALNTINTGAGNDTIFISNYANNATINSYNYIDAGTGDDSIYAYGNYQTLIGGSGNDTIWANGTNQSISGGEGADLFIFREASDNITITDFSIEDNDRILLLYHTDSATYTTSSGIISLGDVDIYLENATDIVDFLDMTIYQDSYIGPLNRYSLKGLMGAKVFDWSDGEYYFLIEDEVEVLSIYDGALAYDGTILQDGKKYAKVTVENNNITFEAEEDLRVEIDAPTTTYYSLLIDNTYYIFNGAVQLFNTPSQELTSLAYTGNFIVSGSMYYFDGNDDTMKYILHSGAAETDFVDVTIGGDNLIISGLAAGNQVSLMSVNYLEVYTADGNYIIKETISDTLDEESGETISEEVHTYQAGYTTADIVGARYRTVNHYISDYVNKVVYLYAGTAELEGLKFTIVYAGDDGITIIYDENGENLVGISGFDAGESFSIDDETFTLTNGQIIRASDKQAYNGDVSNFIKNYSKEVYWGPFTGWKIEDDIANYYSADEIVITIGGLNMDSVAAVDGEIDGITIENNYVKFSPDLLAGSEVEYDSTGYVLQLQKTYGRKAPVVLTTLLGSSGEDTISVSNATLNNTYAVTDTVAGTSYTAYGTISINGAAGNDLISVSEVTLQDNSNIEITSGEGADTISVAGITFDGANSFKISADEGNDEISFSDTAINNDVEIAAGADDDKISVENVSQAANLNLTADEGNDEILINNLTKTNGALNVSAGEGNDTISVDTVEVTDTNAFNIGGGAGDDSISVINVTQSGGGNSFGVSGGAGNDTISLEKFEINNGVWEVSGNDGDDIISLNEIVANNGDFDIDAGSGSAVISLSNVELNGYGDFNIYALESKNTISAENVAVNDDQTFNIYTGAEDDNISVTSSTGIHITTGEGRDSLHFGGEVVANVSDFSRHDVIIVDEEVDDATFNNGVLTLGTNVLTLQNVTEGNIENYVAAKIQNGTVTTTLGDMLGILYWKVENGIATYGDLATITGLSSSANADDIFSSGTTVTISANALSNTTVSITDGYTLELDTDVVTPEATDAVWELSNGTATYNSSGLTAGYVVEDNQIVYQDATQGGTLATISGLSSAATLDDISLEDDTITISANAISNTTITLTSELYTLALADDVTTPEETPTSWEISNGTAKYIGNGLTAGYVVQDNKIVYQNATSGETLFTVSGLSTTATEDDISLSDTTVTISANALSNKTVSITGDYTLALATDVTTPKSTATSWEVSNGTANYYGAGLTAGYVIEDNQIVYQNATQGELLTTISGLSSNATASDISLKNTTVTISANALAQNTVTITNDYTLKLASDVTKPAATSTSWEVSNGTATYYSAGTSAGYVVSDNTIVYQNATQGEVLATVTGLSSDATVSDISLKNTTVTISENALDENNTVTISDGYTLALASNVTKPKVSTAAGWSVESGTANYIGAAYSGGYVLEDNKISYQAATTGETLITVEGLSTAATAKNLSLSGSTVTVAANALNKDNTVTISDGYTLALASNVTVPKKASTTGSWSVSKGTATYKDAGLTAGYVVEDNQIVYHSATEGDTLITIEGLSTAANASHISLNGTTVTISANALSKNNTVTISDGYTLALGSNVAVPTETSTSPTWTVSKGTATYTGAGLTAGYVIEDNQIVYQAETAGETLITITGLSTTATASNLSLNKKVVTVAANALNRNNTVEIEGDGYTLALDSNVTTSTSTAEGWTISSGTATYNTASNTAGYTVSDNKIYYVNKVDAESLVSVTGLKKTATAKNLSLAENVVSVAAAAVDKKTSVTVSNGYELILGKGTYSSVSVVGGNNSDSITNNGNGVLISTGAGNDFITLGNGSSKNTINAGAGNDSITATKGKNIYTYASGDGDDTISGFTTNDTLKITSGNIESWSVEDSDLTFKIGSGSITIKDGAEMAINIVDSGSTKATAQIFEDGVTYNTKKTSATLSSNYEGTFDAPSSVISVDGSAADSVAINGNTKANLISGGAGADTLYGGKGNDTLTGGDGTDIFIYGQVKSEGNDIITDYAEEDKISIGSTTSITSVSVKSSKSSLDVVFKLGTASLTLKDAGGKKITTVDSLGNEETAIYESGKVYDADKTSVTFTGSSFKGSLDSGIITADGSSLTSASSILGNASDNVIIGGKGADKLNGNSGNDSLSGGKGNDTLWGGAGNDTLTGGDGTDVYIYEGGNDLITDYVAGEKISLNTSITGFAVEENNVILGTANGSITVAESAGEKITTVVKVGSKTTTETFIYGAGYVYNKNQTAVTLDSSYEGTYSASISSVVSIDGAAADSIQIIGNAKANKIIGGDGADTIHGGKGNDTLTGGAGADVFIYGKSEGNDVITDYAEGDKISVNASISSVSVNSAKNPDVVLKFGTASLNLKNAGGKKVTIVDSLGAESTFIYENGKTYDENKENLTLTSAFKGTLDSGVITADGSGVSGAMKIIANAENNIIIGGKGKDTLSGLAGNDTLDGGDGNDSILGGDGNDSLFGGKGNDTLNGGAGNDTLTGGAGTDVFIYEGGNDLITDYTAGEKISLKSAITGWTVDNDKNVIFETAEGTITVANGKGKNITTVVGKTSTTEKYSNSSVSAKTLDLLYDNNFMTDENNLDSITDAKYSVTDIDTGNKYEIAKVQDLLTFHKDK